MPKYEVELRFGSVTVIFDDPEDLASGNEMNVIEFAYEELVSDNKAGPEVDFGDCEVTKIED